MTRETILPGEAEGEEKFFPIDVVIENLDRMRLHYIQNARNLADGKKPFGDLLEINQYRADLSSVADTAITLLGVLEMNESETKELLRKLRDTYAILLEIAPTGTKAKRNPEEVLKMLDKHLEE